MTSQSEAAYIQPILVVTSEPQTFIEGLSVENVTTAPPSTSIELLTSNSRYIEVALRTPFSNVPIISESQLLQEYIELGDALQQLVELNAGDEWRIEQGVFDAACFVAAELKDYSFPAPHVFTHGPTSVVFTWKNDFNSLYLTISSDRMSALVSTAKIIGRRIDFPPFRLAAPKTALLPIEYTYSAEPISRFVSPTVNAPLRRVG
jgi:hypothetical protein